MRTTIWGGVLGVVVVALGLAGWNAQAATSTDRSVKLLFAHSSGCGHCAYQRPIVRQFEVQHPEVTVKWVRYADLNREEQQLLDGTTGHPVMVFHGDCHLRQVVGETSLDELEAEYAVFKKQLKEAGPCQTTTTGSDITCRY